MAKQILFTYEGTDYTLEYNRKSVVELEKRGFVVNKINTEPLEQLSLLFYGAFLMHHPNTSRAKTDEICEALGNKEELWSSLTEMYAEPVNAFMGGEEDDGEGKVKWGATWEKKPTPPRQNR